MCMSSPSDQVDMEGYKPLAAGVEGETRPDKWNKNATLVLIASFVCALVESLSLGALFDIYLFGLSGSNSFVGSVESCRGLVALLCAVPIGIIGDKYNRRTVLVMTVWFGLFCASGLAVAIYFDSIWGIYGFIGLWALAGQSINGNMQAMLADSLPAGPIRVLACTYSSVAVWMGLAFGPLIQIVMMEYSGNTWELSAVRNVILLGLISYIPLIPAIVGLDCMHKAKEEFVDAQKPWSQEEVCGVKKQWVVPILIEFGNLTVAFGAGMTVKFFPLFFKQEYNLLPVSLNAINFIFPCCVAALSVILGRFGDKVGRAQACFIFQCIGTLGLYVLSFSKPLYLTLVLFLIRGSFMNATSPLNQSIIMDCVHPSHRGRWSSIQSLGQATWAGSAAFGGWLADRHSYRFTFLITAVVYTIATLSYTGLNFLVPKELPNKKA